MEKINGNDILCEFDLEEAKNSEGKEIEISACVHKVKKMGGFAFVITERNISTFFLSLPSK